MAVPAAHTVKCINLSIVLYLSCTLYIIMTTNIIIMTSITDMPGNQSHSTIYAIFVLDTINAIMNIK